MDEHQVLPLGRTLWCEDAGWSLPNWEQLYGKEHGALGRHKLSMSQQHALAAGMANSFLERIHRGTVQQGKGLSFSAQHDLDHIANTAPSFGFPKHDIN